MFVTDHGQKKRMSIACCATKLVQHHLWLNWEIWIEIKSSSLDPRELVYEVDYFVNSTKMGECCVICGIALFVFRSEILLFVAQKELWQEKRWQRKEQTQRWWNHVTDECTFVLFVFVFRLCIPWNSLSKNVTAFFSRVLWSKNLIFFLLDAQKYFQRKRVTSLKLTSVCFRAPIEFKRSFISLAYIVEN